MNNDINNVILQNGMYLYKYLAHYGVDHYNTKRDLILLIWIKDILEQNCYYDILNECMYTKLVGIVNNILNNNPRLKYCRIDLWDYKNLGEKQNIDTYKNLPEEDDCALVPEEECWDTPPEEECIFKIEE